MASSVSAQVDSDDEEVFWGPITLKEIKASLKIAEKLNSPPKSEIVKDQRLGEENKANFTSTNDDQKKNELCFPLIQNGNFATNSTKNQTPEKSPNNLKTSHIASTPRKLTDVNSYNNSKSTEGNTTDCLNVTPQTSPVKEPSTSTYTTPSLLSPSPSQNDCDSSFASVTSSFVDESESPALEVASESFEKVDPKRYNARNINLNNSNSITDSHPESEDLGELKMDSNFNPVLVTNHSFTKFSTSDVKSKSSEAVEKSLIAEAMPNNNGFFSLTTPHKSEAKDEKLVSLSPFQCVNEPNVAKTSYLINDLHSAESSDLNKVNGNYVSPEIKFQSFQKELENKSFEKNFSPDLKNISTLNTKNTVDKKNPLVFRESKLIMEYESMLNNFTSKLSKESEKLIDDFKAEITFDFSEENISDASNDDEEMKTDLVTADLKNACGPPTSSEKEDVKMNSPFDNARFSLKPLNFSQLTEVNISLESPPNLTILDDTLTSVNQSRLSIPANDNFKSGKKMNKGFSNLPTISEKLNPKKKFFSSLAVPKVHSSKQSKGSVTPTDTKEYSFKTPASKEPKKSETEVPVTSHAKSKLLPLFNQGAIGKVTPSIQKTPTKNQSVSSDQKKKFFSTPQSVKSLKNSKLKQGMLGVNSKFDRLSPSNNTPSSPPNSASVLEKNLDSCEKARAEPKRKFFSASQFSRIPSGVAKLEAPKKNINSTSSSKSPKLNCSVNPPKAFSQNNSASPVGKTTFLNSQVSVTSIPKFFPRNLKKTVQNQENVSNSASKSENLESPAAKYNSDVSLPLSDTSFNNSVNSNKSLTSRIPKQNSVENGSKNVIKSRLPRFNDASKIPKVNFTPIRKTEKQ